MKLRVVFELYAKNERSFEFGFRYERIMQKGKAWPYLVRVPCV